ncbi:Tat pathway signal protein [Paratractidigestivibacter sp.]|uniref:PcsB-like coiled-coil domain-containing protein n=1 Tax=Paratractidigestivibacter sp. TaxID=2847316 RepID=UPI002ABE5A70|nr:Tat pathway signal protein [Paratractidigestivibacter sp.]
MNDKASSISRRDALRLLMGAGATLGAAAAFKPAAAIAVTAQQKADNAQAQADKTQQDLEAAQSEYEAAQKKLSAIADEYAAAAASLSATRGQIADLTYQISVAEETISATEKQIEETQKDIEAKQAKLSKRMSAAYKSGAQSTIDLLLSSTSFEELTSNVYYLDHITESDKSMIREVKTLKASLEEQKAAVEKQKAELESEKADLEVLESQQATELEAAQVKQDEAASYVSSLSSSVQSLVAQHDSELAAAQEAAAEAKKIAAQAKTEKKSWATTANTQVLGNGNLAKLTSAVATTASPGSGLCAAWVTYVFANAGLGSYDGNACDMCAWWCGTSVSNIKPGMIIAVESSSSGSTAGKIYGHIGIYLSDGLVHHNVGYIMTDTVASWTAKYCKYMDARCGWLGGIALS